VQRAGRGTARDLPRPARLRLEAPAGRYEIHELADDVLALLDELGLEEVDLIGHGLGWLRALHRRGAPEVVIGRARELFGPVAASA
jgi:pimeloyl-ACP methyl ester carboxylesterase